MVGWLVVLCCVGWLVGWSVGRLCCVVLCCEVKTDKDRLSDQAVLAAGWWCADGKTREVRGSLEGGARWRYIAEPRAINGQKPASKLPYLAEGHVPAVGGRGFRRGGDAVEDLGRPRVRVPPVEVRRVDQPPWLPCTPCSIPGKAIRRERERERDASSKIVN